MNGRPNRHLAKEYAVVYIDATMMPLRRDTVQKEAVHIALMEQRKSLIIPLPPNESKTNWKEMIESIRERGIERVALFCTDGLNGMEEVIAFVYPMSRIQRCLLHVQRNISSKCRVSDRAEITEDFKAKEQFPTELSEEKFLVSQFERYNEKFLNRIHK